MLLKRIENVKYIGVYLDDKLNWSYRVKYLSLQLSRYSDTFYQIVRLASPCGKCALCGKFTPLRDIGTYMYQKVILA